MVSRKSLRKYVPWIAIMLTAALALAALYLAMDEGRAVQATAFATLVLCVITGWYAWLTNRMVSYGNSQTLQLRRSEIEQLHSEAMILANLADRVGAGLRELPASIEKRGFDSKLREGALWSRDDLRELEKLSARLGPWASGPLVNVTNYLLWMDARIREVQSVPKEIGYDYRQFPGERWLHAWSQSDKHLGTVASLARGEAERLSRAKKDWDKELSP